MKNPVPLYLHLLYLVFEHTLDFIAHGALSPGRGRPVKQNSVVLTVHKVFCCRFCDTGVFFPEVLPVKKEGAHRSKIRITFLSKKDADFFQRPLIKANLRLHRHLRPLSISSGVTLFKRRFSLRAGLFKEI